MCSLYLVDTVQYNRVLPMVLAWIEDIILELVILCAAIYIRYLQWTYC